MNKKLILKEYDKHLNGIILGIISPLLVLFIVYLIKFNDKISVLEFIKKMYLVNALSPLLSLCAIINLGLFYLLYHFWYNNAARGVIIATFFFAFVVLILKLSN